MSPNHEISQALLSLLQPLSFSGSKSHPSLLFYILDETPTLKLLLELSHGCHLRLPEYRRQYALTLVLLVSETCWEKM